MGPMGVPYHSVSNSGPNRPQVLGVLGEVWDINEISRCFLLEAWINQHIGRLESWTPGNYMKLWKLWGDFF